MKKQTEKPSPERKKKPFLRRKVCRFCTDTVSYTHLTLPTIYSV
mgnify:CR=1 FL=1